MGLVLDWLDLTFGSYELVRGKKLSSLTIPGAMWSRALGELAAQGVEVTKINEALTWFEYRGVRIHFSGRTHPPTPRRDTAPSAEPPLA